MICASTVDAEIKPSSALTESRGGWKPGRKRRGKWTAEGKVNGVLKTPCIRTVCLR